MSSINMVTFRRSPWSTVYSLLGWITQNPYVSSRPKMFLKCQLWQGSRPHTFHIRFLQKVCFIYRVVYYLSRRKILWAGSSVRLAETKPCVAVQSLAVFHPECRPAPLKKEREIFLWWHHPIRQRESCQFLVILNLPTLPKHKCSLDEWQWKQQSIKFTWPRSRCREHISHGNGASSDAEPHAVLQECQSQKWKTLQPFSLWISPKCLSSYWECGIFFKNMTGRSLWASQLTLEFNSLHSCLDSAVSFCILIFCRVAYGFKRAVSYYGM